MSESRIFKEYSYYSNEYSPDIPETIYYRCMYYNCDYVGVKPQIVLKHFTKPFLRTY